MRKKILSESGVTLIELMILTVIVGIVAAMAVPRFQIAMERMRIKTSAREIHSTIRLARSYAISEKQQFGVQYDSDERIVTVFRDITDPGLLTFDPSDVVVRVDTLPQEFTWIGTDCLNNVVFFRPNGSARFTGNGNLYLLAVTEKVVSITQDNILASTGRVKHYFWAY